jgi:hypothetical protein
VSSYAWLGCGCLLLVACAREPDRTAAGSSLSAATVEAPAPPPPPPAAPTPAALVQPPTEDPCRHPEIQTLDLKLGMNTKTPWQLELTYAIDDDRKLGPGYMFLLHSGDRRWQTRRDARNWKRTLLWRGYCWHGVGRPGARAEKVRVAIAPLCKDGKLQELGHCAPAFGH